MGPLCTQKHFSSYIGHSTENVIDSFSQPQAWAALGFVRFVPRVKCWALLQLCETLWEVWGWAELPGFSSHSHIPGSARVLLMWRIRNSSCFTDLVYKLLYSGLKSPDFKFHSHKFVGTHDWLMGLSPAFFQLASPSFLWLEVFGILQNKENIQENAGGEVVSVSLPSKSCDKTQNMLISIMKK